MRIYEYAKEKGVGSKAILELMSQFTPHEYTASSNLHEAYVEELEKIFNKQPVDTKPPVKETIVLKQLETTYQLDVRSNEGKIWVIVGCGGNGAYLIPNLLRQISIQNKRLELAAKRRHKVVLIDADVVEDKNLTRQNFVRTDVGRNKAEVMAMRYGRAFGMEIDFLPEYIESSERLTEIVAGYNLPPVFIGAVDNNKTRVLINGAYTDMLGAFWIDAGNEEWGGQVVCGYNYNHKAPTEGRRDPHAFHLPSVIELYPEVGNAQDKLPTELSCAEHAVSSPQNIFTNMTAANLVMGFANTILTANAREKVGLKQHAVAFNSETMSFTTRLNKTSLLIPAEQPAAEQAEELPTSVAPTEVAATEVPSAK